MDTDIRRRRLRGLLHTAGMGVILFSAWSLIKSGITLILNFSDMSADFVGTDGEALDALTKGVNTAIIVLAIVLVMLISAVDTWLHLIVGLQACAYSRGRRQKASYLGLAILLASLSLIFIAIYIFAFFTSGIKLTLVVTAITELTATGLLLEVIIFTNVLKKSLKKEA